MEKPLPILVPLFQFKSRMEWQLLSIVLALAALVLGWYLGKAKEQSKQQALQAQLQLLQSDKAVALSLKEKAEETISELQQKLQAMEEETRSLFVNLSQAKTENELTQQRIDEYKQHIEESKVEMQQRFQVLAQQILDDKALKFSHQNKESIEAILQPLKEKIQHFEQKVEKSYMDESKERHTLKSEIEKLITLNTHLNEEASKLSKALKGDNKKQGNWGELILERVLEHSGLKEGREYHTQYSTSDSESGKLLPDVIIQLPDNRHIIIDSKVSLTAFERVVNAETTEEKEIAIKAHVLSVKEHIKGLSDKEYFKAKGLQSPDFVLMFIPIEGSFATAIEADNALFSYAWDRKIVPVSPSTLLATLKTVASLWRQERQNLNAAQIAQEAGNLYDKFELLLSDLRKLGSQLDTVQKTYNGTVNKLKEGKGNLISKVHRLKTLGAKTSKQIDVEMLEEAEENNWMSEENNTEDSTE
jgi:DNA recombination protein RmuC